MKLLDVNRILVIPPCKDRSLRLTSDTHTYKKRGKYRILVKVIDIFGNDTSQVFEAEVR